MLILLLVFAAIIVGVEVVRRHLAVPPVPTPAPTIDVTNTI